MHARSDSGARPKAHVFPNAYASLSHHHALRAARSLSFLEMGSSKGQYFCTFRNFSFREVATRQSGAGAKTKTAVRESPRLPHLRDEIRRSRPARRAVLSRTVRFVQTFLTKEAISENTSNGSRFLPCLLHTIMHIVEM